MMMSATEVLKQPFRETNTLEKWVRKPWFWAILTFFFFAYPLTKSVLRQLPDQLPVLGAVPAFNWTDDMGRTLVPETLRGKTYVVHFLDMSDETIVTQQLKDLQKTQHRVRGVKDRFRLITVMDVAQLAGSLDAAKDQQKWLYEKARSVQANPQLWHFVSSNELKSLVSQFYPLQGPSSTASLPLRWREQLVLIDSKGQIRSHFPLTKQGINHLMIQIGLLINHQFHLSNEEKP